MKIAKTLAAAGATVALALGFAGTASAAGQQDTGVSDTICQTTGVGTATAGAWCEGETNLHGHYVKAWCSDGSVVTGATVGDREWSYATCPHPQAVTNAIAVTEW
ncbi:hypothetical protein [Streptomyces sp. NPDC006784]|uniref:hypothetical protein n=1 Tax=Streptomyces sp. NPDC006784 TaxID=3364764 RepID=UPI0036737708